MPDSHRAQTHIHVTERDRDQTRPGPAHVPAVQAARTIVRHLLRAMLRQLAMEAADDVSKGMTAERVAAEEYQIRRKDEGSDSDPELATAIGPREPERLPDIRRE